MTEDLTSVDFFRDSRLTDDPFPFYEALRNKCPVSREDHYGVTFFAQGNGNRQAGKSSTQHCCRIDYGIATRI